LFWIFSIVLLSVAALFVLFPLWKHYRPASSSDEVRKETNLTIFEERQRELQREQEQGNLDTAQYEALLLELKKSLLSDTVNADNQAGSKASSNTTRTGNETMSKAVPLLMVLLIPVVAYVMYGQWGYLSDVQLMPLYEQSISASNSQEESMRLASELSRVALADESNPWARYFLARNFANAGVFDGAELAYQEAADLLPDGPDKAATLGQLAQVKYVLAGGELNEEVLAVIQQARSINPSEVASLQLLSLDAEVAGEYQAAIGYWRLMIQANPTSSMAQQLRQRITEAQRLIAQEGGAEIEAGPSIEVSISLAEGLVLPAGLRLFVAARNAAQEGMPPLAATDLRADDLPATVILDNSMAITPMFNLSSADTIYISATVSLTGSATVQSGDYRVISGNFAHNDQHAEIDLVIRDTVP